VFYVLSHNGIDEVLVVAVNVVVRTTSTAGVFNHPARYKKHPSLSTYIRNIDSDLFKNDISDRYIRCCRGSYCCIALNVATCTANT